MTIHMLEHALDYAHDGWEVFPLNPDKTPKTANGFKDASSDPEQVERWWTAHPNAMIGCRIPAGMMAFDIDPRHGGDKVWAALIDLFGPVPTSRCHFSGRNDGGFHVWFQRPDGLLTMSKLTEWAKERNLGHAIEGTTKWSCGIDMLHHNSRYTILPPSPHPDTGEPYHWANEGDVAVCPPWLADMIVSTDAPKARPKRSDYNGDSVADWFDTAATWPQILEPKGWKIASGNGDADGSRWLHPTATAAHSATISNGCLFVYSPNTPFPETMDGAPAGQTRFRAFAVLYHGGDLKAAAKDAGQMPGAPKMPERDMSAFIEANTPAPAYASTEAAPEAPPFPIEALPEFARDHIASVAHNLQTPVDMTAQIALGALSAICNRKRCTLEVTPSWIEGANLYLAIAMPPGAGKSPAIKQITAPIEAISTQHRADTAMANATRAAERITLKATLDRLEKDMSSGTSAGTEVARDYARALVALNEHDAATDNGRFLADDTTPEALIRLLHNNAGRIALISAEGGLFDNLGRYAEKGKAPNLDGLLKIWSGDTIRVDRVGGEPLEIEDPRAVVCITVQPSIVRKILNDGEFQGRGLVARFMLSLPTSLVGRRNMRAAHDVDGDARRRWEQGVYELYGSDVANLRMTQEAAEAFNDYRQGLEDRRFIGGDLETAWLTEMSTKCESSVARVALILAACDGSDVVDLDHIERAIAVGDYWIGQALALAGESAVDQLTSAAQRVLAWAAAKELDEVDGRIVQRSGVLRRTPYADAEGVAKVFTRIDEMGRGVADLTARPVSVDLRDCARLARLSATDSVRQEAPTTESVAQSRSRAVAKGVFQTPSLSQSEPIQDTPTPMRATARLGDGDRSGPLDESRLF